MPNQQQDATELHTKEKQPLAPDLAQEVVATHQPRASSLKRAARIAHPEKAGNGGKHNKLGKHDKKSKEENIDYARYRVEPGRHIRLAEIDPNNRQGLKDKESAKRETARLIERISDLQAALYAEHEQSLLIVLQAIDTGGKDGTIRGVFEGVNPQGCQVWSFKEPSTEELAHDFLWRVHQKTPEKGMITVFNRSHYEDVLVVRVKKLAPAEVWSRRYELINDFEKMLVLNNTAVLKIFLHISKDEQKRRLESRLQQPDKNWKFSMQDIAERSLWDDYAAAFEDAVNNCATDYAPWYVVPANNKWFRNLVVARIVVSTLEAMNPKYPKISVDPKKVIIG